MDLRTKWPEHRELNQPRKSDFNTFHPAVAKAMREQGMESFNQLGDRIEWILGQPEMKGLFGGSFNSQTYHTAVSANAKRGESALYNQNGLFTKEAQLIALALEKDPEDLFPHVLEAPVYLEEQEELDENQVDVKYARILGFLEGDLEVDVKRAVQGLFTPREDQVIVRRFGLRGHDANNRQDIADDLGLTYGRVLDLENAAIRKLKRFQRYNFLQGHLGEHWSIDGAQASVDIGDIELVDEDGPVIIDPDDSKAAARIGMDDPSTFDI